MRKGRLLVALAASVGLGALALTTALAQPAGDSADSGRALFFSQGCYGCHRLGQAGTPIAYDLSHVGRKYSEAAIADWLRDPAKQKPTAHMPRLTLTDDEIRALARYLGSLR
jgi:mono/diheme cytochrome c family protein